MKAYLKKILLELLKDEDVRSEILSLFEEEIVRYFRQGVIKKNDEIH